MRSLQEKDRIIAVNIHKNIVPVSNVHEVLVLHDRKEISMANKYANLLFDSDFHISASILSLLAWWTAVQVCMTVKESGGKNYVGNDFLRAFLFISTIMEITININRINVTDGDSGIIVISKPECS